MGFEALLCGKPLTTFGLPWYAGWGVSDDRHPQIDSLVQTQRRTPRNLLQLFAAAYLQYSRYLNPNTGEAGSLFDVIDYLATVKRKNDKLRGELYCVGMSLWKRAVAKPFFNVPSCRLKFYRLHTKTGRGQTIQRCTHPCLGQRQRGHRPFCRTTQHPPAAHGRRLYPLGRAWF